MACAGRLESSDSSEEYELELSWASLTCSFLTAWPAVRLVVGRSGGRKNRLLEEGPASPRRRGLGEDWAPLAEDCAGVPTGWLVRGLFSSHSDRSVPPSRAIRAVRPLSSSVCGSTVGTLSAGSGATTAGRVIDGALTFSSLDELSSSLSEENPLNGGYGSTGGPGVEGAARRAPDRGGRFTRGPVGRWAPDRTASCRCTVLPCEWAPPSS